MKLLSNLFHLKHNTFFKSSTHMVNIFFYMINIWTPKKSITSTKERDIHMTYFLFPQFDLKYITLIGLTDLLREDTTKDNFLDILTAILHSFINL